MTPITLTPQTPREEQMLLALQQVLQPTPDTREEPLTSTAAMYPDETREHINRLVGTLSLQLARSQQEVYVWSYHEFYKRTGFHPVTETKPKGTHLSTALAYPGGGEILLDILKTRLQTPATPANQFTPGSHESVVR